MRTYTARAYAKLNLSLDIQGLREDGYHELESVMQTVSVWDDLPITIGEGEGITLSCDLSYIPTDDRNLAVRAAKYFYEALGRPAPDLHIHIEKKIPVGAGMAGGSADAAAVLRLLNQAEGKPLSVSLAGNAGSTDLLITWLYKMTVTDSNYKLAAVMGILVFVVCAVINLVVYNMIPSVKNEEDFQ